MGDAINFFLPISKVEKQEDGSRLVSGFASTPTKDLDGEIVSIDAIKGALPGYMEWRNIREMHQSKAVGRAKEATIDEDGLYLTAKIVDEACIKLIDEQVLQGFSIGGRKLAKKGDTITELELIEISVVDRPANPDCRIEIVKAAKPVAGFEVQKMGLANVGLGLAPGDDLVIPAGDVGPLRKFFSTLFGAELSKREFSDKERQDAADSGAALPDGSYPIKTKADLHNAIQAFGRAKNKAKVKAHIKRRAAALGATDALPEEWGKFAKDAKSILSTPLRKMMGHEIYDAATAMDALRTVCWVLESEMMEQAEGEADDGDVLQMEHLREAIVRLKAFIASEIEENDDPAEEPDKQSAAGLGKDNPEPADDAEAVFAQLRKDLNMGDLNKMSHAHKMACAKAAGHLDKAMACHKAAMGCMHKAAMACTAMKAANKAVAIADILKSDGVAGHIAKAAEHMDNMAEHHEMAAMHLDKMMTGSFAGEGGGKGVEDEDEVGGTAGEVGQGEMTEGEVPEYEADEPYPNKGARGRRLARGAGMTKEQIEAIVEGRVKAAVIEKENELLKAQVEMFKSQPGPNRSRTFMGVGGGSPTGNLGSGDPAVKLFAGVEPIVDEDSALRATNKVLTNMFSNPSTYGKSVMSSDFNGRPHGKNN